MERFNVNRDVKVISHSIFCSNFRVAKIIRAAENWNDDHLANHSSRKKCL